MAKPFDKKISSRKIFRARKTFSDRNDFKKFLSDSIYDEQKYDEYRIKVIYGVYGQGKSELMNEFLIKQCLEGDDEIIYCDSIDFKIPKMKQPDEAFLKIADVLINKGNIALPAFTLGFLKYLSLTSSVKNFEQSYPYLFKIPVTKIENSVTNDVLNEIINFATGKLAKELMEGASSAVPFFNIFLKEGLSKGKSKFVKWIQESQVREILCDFNSLNKVDLMNQLPFLLGYDVFKSLKYDFNKRKKSKRIIIIIDNYEALWDEMKKDERDRWLYALAKYMPGVLFVLFGRHKIQWADYDIGKKDDEFTNAIDQRLLKGLSDDDADSYLKTVPIGYSGIRKAMINNSKGIHSEDGCLPAYLNIQVDTYELLLNENKAPSVKDFKNKDEEVGKFIINNFLKNVRPELSQMIEVLSTVSYFDKEIVKLFEKNNYFASGTNFDELKEFSFVTFKNDKGYFHSLIRKLSSDQFKEKDPKEYQEINELLSKYYDENIPEEKNTEITPDIEQLLINAASYKKVIDPENFAGWILSKSETLVTNGYYNVLDEQLNQALELLKSSKKPDYVMIGKIYYEMAFHDDQSGSLKKSKSNIQLSLEAFNKVFSGDYVDTIIFDDVWGTDGITELGKNLNIYKLAIELGAKINFENGNNKLSELFLDNARLLSERFRLSFDDYTFARYLASIGRLMTYLLRR